MLQHLDLGIVAARFDSNHKRVEFLKTREFLNGVLGREQVVCRSTVIHAIRSGGTVVTITSSNPHGWPHGTLVNLVNVGGQEFIKTDSGRTPNDLLPNVPEF